MNSCQMNNITNPGAPSSPTGTTSAAVVAAAANDPINISNTVSNNSGPDKQALDNSSSISERPNSPDGTSRSSATPPSVGQQQHQPNPPAETSLKVKIKTNNIGISKPDLIDPNDSNNNSNNKSKSETDSNDNKSSANNKSCSRKSRPNNGDSTLNSSINFVAINSTSGDHHSSIGETLLATKLTGMNNHESSSAENGNQSSQQHQQTPSLSLPPPTPLPPSLSQPTSAPQPLPIQLQPNTQQAQQPIILQPQSQQPLAPPSSTTPQPVPTQEAPALTKTTNSSDVVATTPPEPKPKTTRTRKPPSANSKNTTTANTTSAPAKPESKPRKSKAKQNAENKAAAAAAAAAAATSSASLAPTQLSAQPSSNAAIAAPTSASSDKKIAESQRQTAPSSASKKRKPRSTPTTETIAQPTNPPKRTRKKKVEQQPTSGLNDSGNSSNNNPSLLPTNVTLPLNVTNPQLLTVASSMPMGLSPSMTNMHSMPPHSMQPLNIHSNRPGMSPMEMYDANRLYMTMPYPTSDPMSASSLTRPSLSRLFTSSSSSSVEPSGGPPLHTTTSTHSSQHPDEIAKAFEELKDNVWNQVSRSVIELAQHFDIPSLIGTLYTLRQENEKLVGKVRDLTAKRDQLIATNARYDLPGPLLTQHLSHTSPNFSSVVASLANSPKSMANSSPSPAMNKSPLVPGGSYNHVPTGSSLGPPSGYGRNSPLIGIQTQHSGVSSLKSTIPLPSPPTGALLAHGANNRAGLMTVNNSPYMTNVHPSMNALNQLGGPNTPSSSYYTRQ